MAAPISTPEPVLAAIRASRRRLHGRPVLIAIDGRGGAGKSTIAAALAEHLPRSVVLHADDFAFGWQGGWDWGRFRAQVLQPIREGRPGRYQRYDWESGQLAEWHQVPTDIDALILEGVSVTRKELGEVWDVRVWVEAPAAVRLSRGLERDGEAARGLWERWMAQEDAWVAEERPVESCDFILDGASC